MQEDTDENKNKKEPTIDKSFIYDIRFTTANISTKILKLCLNKGNLNIVIILIN